VEQWAAGTKRMLRGGMVECGGEGGIGRSKKRGGGDNGEKLEHEKKKDDKENEEIDGPCPKGQR
jgi:hypothetical protein